MSPADDVLATTLVESDQRSVFEAFTSQLDQWWPLQPLSLGGELVVRVEVEGRIGGAVTEVWSTDERRIWGHITTWDPHASFGMTWEAMPAVTQVDVDFAALGPSLTRVSLRHSGWEALADFDLAEITDFPGGYSAGWALALERLAVFASRSSGSL